MFYQHVYLDLVFCLCISEDIMLQRMEERAATMERPDDERDKFPIRLNDIRILPPSILDYFRTQGIPVHDIDANRPRPIIDQEIKQLIFEHYQIWEKNASDHH